jgi:hypothetical protein
MLMRSLPANLMHSEMMLGSAGVPRNPRSPRVEALEQEEYVYHHPNNRMSQPPMHGSHANFGDYGRPHSSGYVEQGGGPARRINSYR